MLKKSPLKRTGKPLKTNSTLKRNSKLKKKGKSQQVKDVERAQQQAMLEMFEKVWMKRGPYSEVSGKYLGSECKTIYMHHLVAKSIHPELRYTEDNIMILSWEEHTAVENGYPPEKVVERTKEVKAKYGIV